MRIYCSLKIFLISLLFLSIGAGRIAAQDMARTKILIDSLLSSWPAQSPAEQTAMAQKIIASGDEGIMELCSRLLDPTQGDDSAVRFAVSGMIHTAARGDAVQREEISRTLLKALGRDDRPEVKRFLLSQVQLLAPMNLAGEIGSFLDDPELTDSCARILAGMGGEKAADILLSALPGASEKKKVILINALSWIHYKKALPVILSLTESGPYEVRQAALDALAESGDKRAVKRLQIEADTISTSSRTEAELRLLRLARRLHENGETRESLTLCNHVMTEEGAAPVTIQCTALSLMAEIKGEAVLPDLLHAANSPQKEIRGTALRLAQDLPGTAATGRWLALLSDLPNDPDKQIDIVRMLGKRGDPTALPVILSLLADSDQKLRFTAVEAALLLGKDEVLAECLQAVKDADEEEAEELQPFLLSATSGSVTGLLARSLPLLQAPIRIAALNVLAARRDSRQTEAIMAQVQDADENVRLAAARALQTTAEFRHLQALFSLLEAAVDKREISALQEAVLSASRTAAYEKDMAEPVLKELDAADIQGKILLLPLLPQLGGEHSLTVLRQYIYHDSGDVRLAAVQALALWPDSVNIPILKKIVLGQFSPKEEDAALRGLLITARDRMPDPGKRLQLLEWTAKSLFSYGQKSLLLSGLKTIPAGAALELAAPFLDDPSCRTEAAGTVAEIAFALNPDHPEQMEPEARAALLKAMYLTGDTELRQKIGAYLESDASLKDEYHPLFNGRDLSGWHRHKNLPGHGLAGRWTVEDGVIVGRQDPPGQGGFLTTDASFQDFEIRMLVKIDWPFDSGVFLRVGPQGKSHQITLDYRPGGEIGAVYLPWTQGFVCHCPEGMDGFKKDEWNELRIVCLGEPAKIMVWLNGKLITDFQHTIATTKGVPPAGGIALQVHPGGEGFVESRAMFKDIIIREL